ncbi:MAG: hypothetical protein AAFW73_18075 [Bacteroidota bacterium]
MNAVKIFFLLLAAGLLPGATWAQHILETELQKSPANDYARWGANSELRRGFFSFDQLETNQLNPGQTGYVEFDFLHFGNSDIEIGLRDLDDVNRFWAFHFVNGEIFIDGESYGLCTEGLKYRVGRCDASIKFWSGNQFFTEIDLPDINFTTLSVVKVGTAETISGNLPRLGLKFPILQACQANPPEVTNTAIYADLKKYLDGSFVQVNTPVLNFRYQERYATVAGQNDQVDYLIYDWNKGAPNQAGSLVKRMGTNYFSISLTAVATNTYYTLEVSDAKGERQFLRFLYFCPVGQNCLTPGGGGENFRSSGDPPADLPAPSEPNRTQE